MDNHSGEVEDKLKNLPDNWLAIIANYVMGHHNETIDFSKPVLKTVVTNIYPIFILQYGILAVCGIILNLAIFFYIMRYKLYHEVTYAFIVNLSICHFVQCSLVLPFTLLVLLIQNWVLGQFMCFFMPMLQDIPLHVAMFSHLLIAWDRMLWLGNPLRSRLPSFICSCATWLSGMVIALPYPIYTTYLDLGLYLKHFQGTQICAVNLIDDMHEYMRGLFILMYCTPTVIIAYFYIRTSKDLRPPSGPLSVMMFEHRADIRERQSSSSGRLSLTSRDVGPRRSYDVYDAQIDVNRERRTQKHLGAMAVTQVLCVCPLMILKMARMVVVETYDNSAHYDIVYLLIVWLAFLPTIINPCIFGNWVLSNPAKERLRGYFRLSSHRGRCGRPKVSDESVTVIQDNNNPENDVNENSNDVEKASIKIPCTPKIDITRTGETPSTPIRQKLPVDLLITTDAPSKRNSLTNTNISCSNMTTSTYCTSVGYEHAIPIDMDKMFSDDLESLCSSGRMSTARFRTPSLKNRLDTDSISFNSTSTLARDLEIIDILERKRSIEIQEMLDHERLLEEQLRTVSRQSSAKEKHRRLPDVHRAAATKKLIGTKVNSFPQQNEKIPMGNIRASMDGSYPNHPRPIDPNFNYDPYSDVKRPISRSPRISRTRSSGSGKLIKQRERRISGPDQSDVEYEGVEYKRNF